MASARPHEGTTASPLRAGVQGVHRAVAPPPSKWLGMVQIVMVLLLVLGIVAGASGIPTHIRGALLARLRVVEGSFAPHKSATGYGRWTGDEQPLAPVMVAITPTVIHLPAQARQAPVPSPTATPAPRPTLTPSRVPKP